jgi:hypothetical protein
MTTNSNFEDSVHAIAIAKEHQVECGLMLAVTKEQTEQLKQLIARAVAAHTAMGELYQRLGERITSATEMGAKKAVASFSSEASSAAVNAAKRIAAEFSNSSTEAREAAVALTEAKTEFYIAFFFATVVNFALMIIVARW